MTFTEWKRVKGGGEMPPSDDDHPAWIKLTELHARGDIETLERMVKFWEALEAFGRLGDLLRRLVIWLGVLFGAYFAFTEYVAGYIKRTVGQ